MSSLIMGSSCDLMPFCITLALGLTRVSNVPAKAMLVRFDGDVIADSGLALSKPGWNIGFPPVTGAGRETLLHSRKVEVPCAVEEFVGFVPFFSLLPAGMSNADSRQGFNPLEKDVNTGLLPSHVRKLGWSLPFYGQTLHLVES